MENFKNFINGSWVEPESGKYSENINPANTDEILGMFPLSNRSDVDKSGESCTGSVQVMVAGPRT